MTKSEKTAADSAEDYRASHLKRGDSYDATLAAGPFDAYMARIEDEHLRRIVPVLFAQARPRYLDFACGTGRIISTVAPMCAEAVGVDISPSMLEQARPKTPTAQFVQADLTRADVDLGQFDLVTSFRFFGNAQHDLRLAVMKTLHRVLRSGGHLIINSHRNPHSLATLLHAATGGSFGGMDLHYFKLKSLLRDCGFAVAQVYPIGAWMYRYSIQGQQHEPQRAAQLERRFSSPIFAPVSPDVVVVARKIG